jgi:hypothetical protein
VSFPFCKEKVSRVGISSFVFSSSSFFGEDDEQALKEIDEMISKQEIVKRET